MSDEEKEPRSMSEVAKEVIGNIINSPAKVYIEGDCVVINESYPYQIELSRCNTPEKILAWVIHLSEKTWMNTDLMAAFIYWAAEGNKITIPDDLA